MQYIPARPNDSFLAIGKNHFMVVLQICLNVVKCRNRHRLTRQHVIMTTTYIFKLNIQHKR